MTTPPLAPPPCPGCGTPVSGRFCTRCGTPAGLRRCHGCAAELSPRAGFCHRCGVAALDPAEARRDRTAWTVAGALVLLSLTLVFLSVRKGDAAAAGPAMANAGNASSEQAQAAGTTATPPDISAMTPRERFDRLFNRIMTAASNGDSATVVNFTPMGLQAYTQLPASDADTDARYHVALLHAQVGEFAEARALADTIARTDRGHLFAPLIRGTVAELAGDQAALRAAGAEFLKSWVAEMARNRPEYQDHKLALDNFKAKAGAGK